MARGVEYRVCACLLAASVLQAGALREAAGGSAAGERGARGRTGNEHGKVHPAARDEAAASVLKSLLGEARATPRSAITPQVVRPGTLPLSRLEALQQCAAASQQTSQSRFSYYTVSDPQKLVYVHVPKSGSSSSRSVMLHHHEANRWAKDPVDLSGYTAFSYVREPLDRFFAQYDEMYARCGPWRSHYNVVPTAWRWLYKNMTEYQDYQRLWCPASFSNKKCIEAPPVDNRDPWGPLSRFEGFAKYWNASVSPWDEHLELQVPLLLNRATGVPKVAHLYDMGDLFSLMRNYSEPNARSFPRRFNSRSVSNSTLRRLCRTLAREYCCLNYPLPEVCASEDAAGVFCEVDVSERIHAALRPQSVLRLAGHDLGADALDVARSALQAWRKGEVLAVDFAYWPAAAGVCPAEDWSCFFQDPPDKSPLSSQRSDSLADAVGWVLRPKEWLAKRVQEQVRRVALPQSCAAVHVPFGTEATRLDRMLTQAGHQNILLLTDDAHVLASALADARFNVFVVDKARSHPSDGPAFSGSASVESFLVERELARSCAKLVGSRGSGLSELLFLDVADESKKVLLD